MSNRPDPTEARLRLGCGGVFGFLVAFGMLMSGKLTNETLFVALVFVLPLVCGVLAYRYGDSFWFAAARVLRGLTRR
ncbi:MAG: hypothetical protein GY716_17640 [bacterium]|nr:hypothetical protein [bacterium]